MALKGDTVAGKKVELVLRDDAGTGDQTRRIAQELVVNDGVSILAGFGLTPLAMSVAPVLNQAKDPAIITSATTSAIMKQSDYFVRTSMGGPQSAVPVATWAVENTMSMRFRPRAPDRVFFSRFRYISCSSWDSRPSGAST